MTAILPGSTLGILGGGQLGRMTAMAARSLGYHLAALDPDPSCAARFVVESCITAGFDDVPAAARAGAAEPTSSPWRLRRSPSTPLRAVQQLVPMRPGAGGPLHHPGPRPAEGLARRPRLPGGPLPEGGQRGGGAGRGTGLGRQAYVKSTRGGYDGRGQAVVHTEADVPAAWASLGGGPVVVEQALALAPELSVLVARRPSGEARSYAPALNHHVQGILEWSVLPGPLPGRAVPGCRGNHHRHRRGRWAWRACWWPSSSCTEDGQLLVNELAPRPHNTFHTTEVACATSQFEQVTRAVCDLPLGSTEVLRPGGHRQPPRGLVAEAGAAALRRCPVHPRRHRAPVRQAPGTPRAEDGPLVRHCHHARGGAAQGAGGATAPGTRDDLRPPAPRGRCQATTGRPLAVGVRTGCAFGFSSGAKASR